MPNADFDLVIIGAGPAGLSAALWAASLDLVPLVLEAADRTGGQLHRIHFEPKNAVGHAAGDGAALNARIAEQVRRQGIAVRTGVRVTGIRSEGAQVTIETVAGPERSRAAIVASGLRRRTLGVPGERELTGRGVTDSATRDLERLAGRDVIVVGGGDAAFENALKLDAAGCRVTIAVRGPVHARDAFRARVAARPVEVLHEHRTTAILGEESVRAVRFETPAGTLERPAQAVVVKIGQMPDTAWCAAALACDPDGYVRVDAALRTSLPRVWAAGDVTRPVVPGIVVAEGHGAIAAAGARDALAHERRA